MRKFCIQCMHILMQVYLVQLVKSTKSASRVFRPINERKTPPAQGAKVTTSTFPSQNRMPIIQVDWLLHHALQGCPGSWTGLVMAVVLQSPVGAASHFDRSSDAGPDLCTLCLWCFLLSWANTPLAHVVVIHHQLQVYFCTGVFTR